MALANQGEKKCFTFLWVLKNADFLWQEQKEKIESTSFIVEEIEETRWKLWLYPRGISTENVSLFLVRYADMSGSEYVEMEYDLAFLNSEREILKSTDVVKASFHKNNFTMEYPTVTQSNKFDCKLRELMSYKTVQVRCRIWKCAGEFSDNMMCLSLNSLSVERTQIMWKIENVSFLDSEKRHIHEIRSVQTGKRLMSLEILPCDLNGEKFKCLFTPRKLAAKSGKLTLELQATSDQFPPQNVSFKGFFINHPDFVYMFEAPEDFLTRFVENKHEFLSNDVLSIRCNIALCYGIVLEEYIFNREVSSEAAPLQNTSDSEDNLCLTSLSSVDIESLKAIRKLDQPQNDIVSESNLSSHGSISQEYDDSLNLLTHFGLMWQDLTHSDIKLKTRNGLYPANKCVLSARSPVFRTLLSNVPIENINDCIDIEKLDGGTVHNMLIYIYSGFIAKLDWDTAFGLYEAGARYKLFVLKDVCSSYLKKHLCLDNAFDTCLLATQNGDDDLKDFVKDFISSRPPSTPSNWKTLLKISVKKFATPRRNTSTVKNDLETVFDSAASSLTIRNACIEDFRSMLECSIHSDVKLRTSDGTYLAHKCVLSARSRVFETMLSAHSKEKDCIDIENLDGGTVCRMLRYVYTGEVGALVWDSATGLYVAANRYEFPILKHVCSSYLMEHLSQHNLQEMLQLIYDHRDVNMANFVLNFTEKIVEKQQKQEEMDRLILEVKKLNTFLKDPSN